MEKIYNANSNKKELGMAIQISDKIYFKTKIVTSDKEKHFITIKGSIY